MDPDRRRAFIRHWIPQGLRDFYNLASGRAIRYRGVYPDWAAAVKAARGYGEPALIERLAAAASSVQRGEAAWEQDGVTHSRIPVDFPQLACMAQVALAQEGQLSVLDFGGGLGSSYLQCRAHLKGLRKLRWSIIEQAELVQRGRDLFAAGELSFYESLDVCLNAENPAVVLLCSVLQYLENPHTFLDRLVAARPPYLLIDRHPQSTGAECITLQVVPASIYQASYPSWLLDASFLEKALGPYYDLQLSWQGKDPPIRGRGLGVRFTGSFWRRKEGI